LQDTENRFKRVLVWGRNINHDLVASLKSFNGCANRVVFIIHIEACFDSESQIGKVFFALEEPVAISKIKARFELLGALEVNWRAFPSNDNNDAASSALCGVRQLAATSKDGGYANGTCDEHLNKRTVETFEPIKQQQQQQEAAELKEKAAADAKLQHDELRGDIAQCTAVGAANGDKIDALGTSLMESAETIVQSVAANGETMGAYGSKLEEISDKVGVNAGWLMMKNDGLEERYTEAVTELAGKKAEMDTAKRSAAGKHGDKMRRLRKEMADMKEAYGAAAAAAVSEISTLKREKEADGKTIALMAQSSKRDKEADAKTIALMAQSNADLRHALGVYECVEKLHQLTERKRSRFMYDSD
jgi:hypothetical protein